MGNHNSGNRCQPRKYRCMNDLLKLPLSHIQTMPLARATTATFKRNGAIIATIHIQRTKSSLHISYTQNGKEHRQRIELQSTACHFGNTRQWLQCPKCQKRVTALYGTPFLCRHCHRLAYPTTRMTDLNRINEKIERIRKRLHWQQGFMNGTGFRPKGMHRKTYRRLVKQHQQIERQIEHEFLKRGFML